MLLKPSHYNHCFSIDDYHVLWNIWSNGILKLTSDELEVCQSILHSPNIPTSNIHYNGFRALLHGNSFLISSEFNEIDNIKKRYINHINSKQNHSIAIILTFACNFKCIYCHQEHVNKTISSSTIRELMNYIKKNIKSGDKLHIAWWGGEPLLQISAIDEIGKLIKDYCMKNKCIFETSIVTNGYLLNEINIDTISKYNLKSAQITIDGNKELHDMQRKLSDENNTYDTILKNLKVLIKKAPSLSVTLRCNIMEKHLSKKTWNLFFNDLQPLAQNLSISINSAVPCTKCQFTEVSPSDYSTLVNYLHDEMHTYNLKPSSTEIKPGICRCGTLPINNFFLDPEGFVFKCTDITHNGIGAVGKLSSGEINSNGFKSEWKEFNPFIIDRCKKCSLLPLCMGGCPKIENTKKDLQKQCLFKSVFRQWGKRLLTLKTGDKNGPRTQH